MTSIGIIHATVSSTVSNTGTTFAEVVESDALTNGTTYHVVCHAIVEGNSSSLPFEWRMVDRTNSDAVLSNSTLIREPTQNGVPQSYYFVGRVTAGSDGGGLAFEQRASTSLLAIARTQYVSMMIFDLSNMQSTDYVFDNDDNDTELTQTMASFAAARITSPSEDDTWLMWAWQATATNNTTVNTEMQLHFDDIASQETAPQISFEGEDLTEVLGWFVSRPFTIDGTPATATWTIKSRDDGSATQNHHLESTIFGIRLDAFRDFSATYTGTETISTSTDWIELESSSFTPTHAGDVIVSAYSTYNPDGSTRKSYQRLQVDGTTSPNAQPDSEYSANANDATDELALGYITKYTGAALTSATLDYDVKYGNSVSKGWKEYSLVAFTTELQKMIVYSAVALDTYNSGDIASQTFASGDVADDTYSSGDVAAEVNPE